MTRLRSANFVKSDEKDRLYEEREFEGRLIGKSQTGSSGGNHLG
jgi:hypothetical protein